MQSDGEQAFGDLEDALPQDWDSILEQDKLSSEDNKQLRLQIQQLKSEQRFYQDEQRQKTIAISCELKKAQTAALIANHELEVLRQRNSELSQLVLKLEGQLFEAQNVTADLLRKIDSYKKVEVRALEVERLAAEALEMKFAAIKFVAANRTTTSSRDQDQLLIATLMNEKAELRNLLIKSQRAESQSLAIQRQLRLELDDQNATIELDNERIEKLRSDSLRDTQMMVDKVEELQRVVIKMHEKLFASQADWQQLVDTHCNEHDIVDKDEDIQFKFADLDDLQEDDRKNMDFEAGQMSNSRRRTIAIDCPSLHNGRSFAEEAEEAIIPLIGATISQPISLAPVVSSSGPPFSRLGVLHNMFDGINQFAAQLMRSPR